MDRHKSPTIVMDHACHGQALIVPTSINDWPNGSIKELQFGSQQGAGRKYTTTQNARQFPANLKVVLGANTLANLTHSYDANGNVTFIDDAVNGSGFDRSMGYDDLDRIKTASGFWSAGSYSFDNIVMDSHK